MRPTNRFPTRRSPANGLIALAALRLAFSLAVPSAHAASEREPEEQSRSDAQVPPGETRPRVRGGIYDKPFIKSSSGRGLSIGGYLDAQLRHERVEGVTDETTFQLERFNLFAHAPVSDRVRVAAELEIEEGGEELTVELAIVDFEIHPALSVRAGILLSPLGRFNIAHDSPANEFVDRPLVSTEIIAATLSEPGMGVHGALFPSVSSRLTYELYLVNGFDDGVIAAGERGTQIPAGKRNWEDNNARPSFVGRIGVSPDPALELGMSAHTGAYNTFTIDGLDVDERRDLTIVALDLDATWNRFRAGAEYARASIDVPEDTGGLFASGQQGVYAEVSARVWSAVTSRLPSSELRVNARGEVVDFDADVPGESVKRFTLGVNLRPTSDTVFKLDWQRTWSEDAFAISENGAGFLLGVASYF